MQDRRAFNTFFGGWSETIASVEFHHTTKQLLQLPSRHYGHEDTLREDRRLLDVTLCLRLTTRGRGGTEEAMELLDSINTSQARVSRMELLVDTVEVGETLLLETFRVVEGLHQRGADAEIKLQLPDHQYETKALTQWKTLFDLVARRHREIYMMSDETVTSSKWDLLVECSEIDTYGDTMINYMMDASGSEESDARLLTACFLALAHAAASVSSISIRRLLEATEDGDHNRSIRARGLAYIMRAGCVETVTVREYDWTSEEVEAMAAIFRSMSTQSKVRELRNPEWREDEHALLSKYDAERFLEDPNELLGLVSSTKDHHESDLDGEDGGGEAADVKESIEGWIIWYGQCIMPSALVASVLRRQEEEQQTRGDQVQCELKRLHLHFEGHDQTTAPIFELVALVGSSLEELNITSSVARLPAAFIGWVLNSCPRLRRLLVETLENEEGIAALQNEPLRIRNHPLESLSVRLRDVSVQPVLQVISQYGAKLQQLRVSSATATPSTQHTGPASQGSSNFFDKLAGTLTTLEVSSLTLKDICGQATSSTSTSAIDTLAKLTSLSLHDTVFDPLTWLKLMDALASNSHPLSRSLRTLSVSLANKTPDQISQLLQMLQANYLLANLQLTHSASACDPVELRTLALETDRVNVRRLKAPLALNCKLALVRGLEGKSLQWEPEAMARVFPFAATTEKRRVQMAFQIPV